MTMRNAPGRPKRPSRWSLKNWPVRWKVFAIVLVPLILAGAFGGLRIYSNAIEARDLQRAADRAEMVPAIVSYMDALNGAMSAQAAGGDVQAAIGAFDSSRAELQRRLNGTPDVPPDVQKGVASMLEGGQAQVNKIGNSVPLIDRVTTYVPILLTAEDAITGLVRVDDQTHPRRVAGPQPRRRRPRADDDGTARRQRRSRTARPRAALPADRRGRHRAVDAARHGPGTGRRLAGGQAAAARVHPSHGTHLGSERADRRQSRAAPVAPDHGSGRGQVDRQDGARDNRRRRRPGRGGAHRSHPRLGDRARRDRAGAAARHPGGAVADPAVAHAARQRTSGGARRPRARNRPGARRQGTRTRRADPGAHHRGGRPGRARRRRTARAGRLPGR